MPDNDPYNLERFISAQAAIFDTALAELKSGHKRTHWMWFIFPQFEGLGHSATSRYYAIRSREEAGQYLRHPVLGARLVQCAQAVLALDGSSALEIFGSPDNLKFRSSMTLFASVAQDEPVFGQVLEKFFDGEWDEMTLNLIGHRLK
jgi:uncharacterized protein (DUF1810 family)